jgi:hypothetical protein
MPFAEKEEEKGEGGVCVWGARMSSLAVVVDNVRHHVGRWEQLRVVLLKVLAPGFLLWRGLWLANAVAMLDNKRPARMRQLKQPVDSAR